MGKGQKNGELQGEELKLQSKMEWMKKKENRIKKNIKNQLLGKKEYRKEENNNLTRH